LKKYKKKGIRYKNGYPDFEPYAYKKLSVKAVVEVNDLEYNEGSDFRKARDAYRQKLKDAGDPNWKKWPNNGGKYSPQGYTWHHHENGTTMILVDSEVHNNARHCGGVSCYK